MASLTQELADQNDRVRERYNTIRTMVQETIAKVRPRGSEVMRDVDTRQMERMIYVGEYFLKILEEHREDGLKAMELIQGWAKADREPERTNPVENDFFPVLIRGQGQEDFPVDHPPAVLTQAGMDHLLNIGAVTSENFPSDGPAFLSNICTAPPRVDGDVVYITTSLMADVPLRRVAEGAGKNAPWDGTGELSYTEDWTVRLSEARRYTPFHLTSMYQNWILLFEKENLSWDECKRRGGLCLLTGTLYLACEWACRKGKAMKKTNAKKDDGYATSILKAWVRGTDVSIPNWMHTWRGKMQYRYISSVDIGYPAAIRNRPGLLLWSRGTLQSAVKAKDAKVAPPPETRMPFVERDEGANPLQSAALTTAASLRFWLCLSACIETTGSCHLDDEDDEIAPFNTYYYGVLSYLGKRPGMLGRKLGKSVVKMNRLLLTEVQMMIPTRPMGLSTNGMFHDAPMESRRISDKWALEILRHNLKLNPGATRLECARAIAAGIPELETGLMAIFMKYSGSEQAIQRHAFTMFNRRFGDVVTHLAAAGSIEGYSRSCVGSLPVAGYKSHAQRKVLEGIDSTAPRDVDIDQRELFERALANVEVPTYHGFFEHLHGLSNSKSAGADRIQFQASGKTLVGEHASDKVENHVSNRKDVLHWISPFIISRQNLSVVPTEEKPFPLGLRSVPARKLRYIYNVALIQQVIIRPLYKAIEKYMKFSPEGYALAKRTGIPVADLVGCINDSIACAHDETLLILAHDASALDQHIGSAHRDVWREVLMALYGDGSTEIVRALEEREGLPPSGMSYGELASNVLKSWDDAYFKTDIPGAPGAVLHVDTQPSGALTTAVDNTIETMGMLKMIERKTGVTQLSREVWGDDCYVCHRMAPGQSAVAVATEAEELAQEGSGQVLGTVADSTSGRGVHFLQVYYFGGQAIQRRIAYDHEKPQAGTRMPGALNDLLDKAIKLASRGGNHILLNILQLITVIEGSYTTQFGRQANTTFDTIAAPGGSTNMVLIGYGQPNSKLFLELMDWFPAGTEIEKQSRLDEPKDIGKRLMSAHADSPVNVSVGGTRADKPYTFRELGEMSSAVLLRADRVFKFTEAQMRTRTFARLQAKGVMEKMYIKSVIRTGTLALGAKLRESRLAPKFKEQALINSNHIPVRYGTAAPTKDTYAPSTHTGIRLGNYLVQYSFKDSVHVLLLPNSTRNEPDRGLYSSYDVVTHDNVSAGISYRSACYHPYACMPEPTSLLLGLFGVHAGLEAMSVSEGISIFSPSHFRHDMTPEEVMGDLDKEIDPADHEQYLKALGFSGREITKILTNVRNINLYRDISSAKDYTSLADTQKSCSIVRVKEILGVTSPHATEIMLSMDRDQMNVIITHVMSLMYDAINVACMTYKPGRLGRRIIAIPSVTITIAAK